MTPWLTEAHPESLAISTDRGDSLTYSSLQDAVARQATALADRGLRPGDALGLQAPNSLDWALMAHAALWLGATLVPLHTGATEAELRHQRQTVPLRLLLTAEDLPTLTAEAATSSPAPPAELTDDTILTVLFTSGSTGASRAVPLTVANHRASARASRARLGVHHDDLWLACLPFCHIGGLAILLRSALYGTAAHITDGFDAPAILDTLAARPITLASFVPTMVRRLLDAYGGSAPTEGDPIVSDLRAVLVGGGPIAPEDLRRARSLGLPVLPTYGMTEAASQLTTLSPDAPDADLHTAGTPLPGVELRIVDGEIRARGPMITAGYLNAPTPRDEEGFFRTGDHGRLRDDGALIIAHRDSDLIVTGGENVTPGEVEAALRSIDAVAEVVVFALDDDEWGESVAAAVVPRGNPDDPDAFFSVLQTRCRDLLAAYKVPRQWFLLTELPTTATGKLHRRALRDRFSPSFCTVEP